MKFNKIVTIATALCLSGLAQASIIDKTLITPTLETKKISTVNNTSAEFSTYKVEPLMATVPSAIASADSVVVSKGTMSIVNIDAASVSDVVGKGSIVRHTLTNELTTLTGNVTVLLNNGVSADELATAAGMEVVSVFSRTNIAILKVSEGKDLVEAYKNLQASGLAAESKIEVTSTIYSAQ
jgi:hypothetical protein